MNVLLLKDVEKLGQAGEIKRVATGYARNFLIPRGLAQPATQGAVKQAKVLREASRRRHDRLRAEARSLAERVQGVTLHFTAHAGDKDRLYGSITSSDIAEALAAEVGEEIDRRRIALEHPLRELGTHTVALRLMSDVVANFAVVVSREGGEESAPAVEAEAEAATEAETEAEGEVEAGEKEASV